MYSLVEFVGKLKYWFQLLASDMTERRFLNTNITGRLNGSNSSESSILKKCSKCQGSLKTLFKLPAKNGQGFSYITDPTIGSKTFHTDLNLSTTCIFNGTSITQRNKAKFPIQDKVETDIKDDGVLGFCFQ